MPPKPTDPAADKAFLGAWDAEIESEEADERELRKQGLADAKGARAKARAELAPASAKLLQAAGLTEAGARKRADDEFDRARKTAAAQRARALAMLKKRSQAHADETKKLLAGVKRGA